jgi:hypothetical protein
MRGGGGRGGGTKENIWCSLSIHNPNKRHGTHNTSTIPRKITPRLLEVAGRQLEELAEHKTYSCIQGVNGLEGRGGGYILPANMAAYLHVYLYA